MGHLGDEGARSQGGANGSEGQGGVQGSEAGMETGSNAPPAQHVKVELGTGRPEADLHNKVEQAKDELRD